MTNRLTTEQLEAIRKRAEAATEGPWVWDDKGTHRTDMPRLRGVPWNVMDFGNNATYYPTEGTPPDDNDAEFIAEARVDIPALLAEVERLRTVAGTLTYAMKDIAQYVSNGDYARATELAEYYERFGESEVFGDD